MIKLINNKFVINDDKTLNFSNDIEFNEIDLIIKEDKSYIHRSRSLLWSALDHSTSHHESMGRFVGDPSKPRTFDDARSLCREYYGDIASIYSRKENRQFQKLCNKISKGEKETCWIGLQSPYYVWENGNYESWSNWKENKPNYNALGEKCTRIRKRDGKWSDYPCNRELYTICEKPIDFYEGSYIVISKQTTKEKAARYCRNEFQSTLATITTATEAIQAKKACRKVAKAPHGCWIGLEQPFDKFDNGIQYVSIPGPKGGPNRDWENGRKPRIRGNVKKCAEILTKTGNWRAIPCDYERFIMCNGRGTGTIISEQDKKYLAQEKQTETSQKIKEEEQLTKDYRESEKTRQSTGQSTGKSNNNNNNNNHINDKDNKGKDETKKEFNEVEQYEKQRQSQLQHQSRRNNQNRNRQHKEPRIHRVNTHIDPSSPIEHQIHRLKAILEQQKQRLDQEKHRFGLQVNNKNKRHRGEDKTIQGFQKQLKTFNKEMDKAIDKNGPSAGGIPSNPFGGAFGGSLQAPVNNPYNHQPNLMGMGMGGNPFGSLTGMIHMMQMNGASAPPPPLQYNQYAAMMNGMKLMNPMGLPQIPGLQGRYAQRRRTLFDDNDEYKYKYKSVSKCIFDSNYQVCIEYDWENDIGSIDAMIYNKKVLKKKNSKRDQELIQYKDFDDNHIQYFLVYEFDFMFDDHNFNETKQNCHYFNNDGDQICIIKNGDWIVLNYFIDDEYESNKTFNYNIDEEWDEIYIGDNNNNNKKCVNLLINALCLIENNVNEYKLEIKAAITYFERFEH